MKNNSNQQLSNNSGQQQMPLQNQQQQQQVIYNLNQQLNSKSTVPSSQSSYPAQQQQVTGTMNSGMRPQPLPQSSQPQPMKKSKAKTARAVSGAISSSASSTTQNNNNNPSQSSQYSQAMNNNQTNITTSILVQKTSISSQNCFKQQGNKFIMNRGYHQACFEMPLYTQFCPDLWQTLISFGHASTDKQQVIREALKTILSVKQGQEKAYLSVFEVRDEKIFDLCATYAKESGIKNRDVIEGKDGYFNVSDLSKLELDPADVPGRAEKSIIKRKGHLCFQLEFQKKKYFFVQLAAPSGQADTNKAFTSLTICLDQLLNGVDPKFVPFRNSKLTKLLKKPLSIASVHMVVCVAQSPQDKYQETLHAFQYAQRIYAKQAKLMMSNYFNQQIMSVANQQPVQSHHPPSSASSQQSYQSLNNVNNNARKMGQVGANTPSNQTTTSHMLMVGNNQGVLKGQIQANIQHSSQTPKPSTTISDHLNQLGFTPQGAQYQQFQTLQHDNSTNTQQLLMKNQPKVKRVTFQLPMDHQSDLDNEIKERLEHNQLYKDDTIFQHMTVFDDVEEDIKKVFKKKDVFKAQSLLGKPVEVSSEEERDRDASNSSNIVSSEKSSNENQRDFQEVQMEDDDDLVFDRGQASNLHHHQGGENGELGFHGIESLMEMQSRVEDVHDISASIIMHAGELTGLISNQNDKNLITNMSNINNTNNSGKNQKDLQQIMSHLDTSQMRDDPNMNSSLEVSNILGVRDTQNSHMLNKTELDELLAGSQQQFNYNDSNAPNSNVFADQSSNTNKKAEDTIMLSHHSGGEQIAQQDSSAFGANSSNQNIVGGAQSASVDKQLLGFTDASADHQHNQCQGGDLDQNQMLGIQNISSVGHAAHNIMGGISGTAAPGINNFEQQQSSLILNYDDEVGCSGQNMSVDESLNMLIQEAAGSPKATQMHQVQQQQQQSIGFGNPMGAQQERSPLLFQSSIDKPQSIANDSNFSKNLASEQAHLSTHNQARSASHNDQTTAVQQQRQIKDFQPVSILKQPSALSNLQQPVKNPNDQKMILQVANNNIQQPQQMFQQQQVQVQQEVVQPSKQSVSSKNLSQKQSSAGSSQLENDLTKTLDTLDLLELSAQMHGLTDKQTNPQLIQVLSNLIISLRQQTAYIQQSQMVNKNKGGHQQESGSNFGAASELTGIFLKIFAKTQGLKNYEKPGPSAKNDKDRSGVQQIDLMLDQLHLVLNRLFAQISCQNVQVSSSTNQKGQNFQSQQMLRPATNQNKKQPLSQPSSQLGFYTNAGQPTNLQIISNQQQTQNQQSQQQSQNAKSKRKRSDTHLAGVPYKNTPDASNNNLLESGPAGVYASPTISGAQQREPNQQNQQQYQQQQQSTASQIGNSGKTGSKVRSESLKTFGKGVSTRARSSTSHTQHGRKHSEQLINHGQYPPPMSLAMQNHPNKNSQFNNNGRSNANQQPYGQIATVYQPVLQQQHQQQFQQLQQTKPQNILPQQPAQQNSQPPKAEVKTKTPTKAGVAAGASGPGAGDEWAPAVNPRDLKRKQKAQTQFKAQKQTITICSQVNQPKETLKRNPYQDETGPPSQQQQQTQQQQFGERQEMEQSAADMSENYRSYSSSSRQSVKKYLIKLQKPTGQ